MRHVPMNNFPMIVVKFDQIRRGICNKIRDLVTTLSASEIQGHWVADPQFFFFSV